MYESPIELITNQIYNALREQLNEQVICSIKQQYCVNVDKDELIRALQYDRNQYDKGYQDAWDSIVRCKDCGYFRFEEKTSKGFCNRPCEDFVVRFPNDFCSYGRKR